MRKIVEKKGITLIALVITIIVLLILAGITINLTIGQGGILNIAEKSGKNYINAADYEQEELAKLINSTDNIIHEINSSRGESDIKLSEIISYLSGKTENSEYDAQLKEVINNKEKIEEICSSEEMFYVCAYSKTIMRLICESAVAREAMYNNATITEPIIRNSAIAVNEMKNSTRCEVITSSDADKVVSVAAPSVVYNGRAFVFSISQWGNAEGGSKYTIHGDYVIGNAQLYVQTNYTHGQDGKKYEVNKFASVVKMQGTYYTGDSGTFPGTYSYAYVFKIDD